MTRSGRCAAEKQALAELPVDLTAVHTTLGTPAPGVSVHRGINERRAVWPVFSVNSLTCEDAGDHRTVVPSAAVARCDVRLVADQHPDTVAELIAAHVARVAPEAEFIRGGSVVPPALPSMHHTWLQSALVSRKD